MKPLALLLLLSALARPADAQTAPAGVAGTWQGEGFPVTVVLRLDGTKLTGTIAQGAAPPTEFTDGRLEGDNVVLKVQIPNGGRTVTFTGTLKGDEISFAREVMVPAGAAPGGGGILGVSGPSELRMTRVVTANAWNGTVRNAPTPRNQNPNPFPRPASLSTRKTATPHWLWRGGDKQTEVRTFSIATQIWELNSFELESDRLTYGFSRPQAGDTVTCKLARQAEGKFSGRCESGGGGGMQLLIDLTPPAPPSEAPAAPAR